MRIENAHGTNASAPGTGGHVCGETNCVLDIAIDITGDNDIECVCAWVRACSADRRAPVRCLRCIVLPDRGHSPHSPL